MFTREASVVKFYHVKGSIFLALVRTELYKGIHTRVSLKMNCFQICTVNTISINQYIPPQSVSCKKHTKIIHRLILIALDSNVLLTPIFVLRIHERYLFQ